MGVKPLKAKDVIVNGLDGSYIVEKSRPLMLMKTVPFSLGELKVLDTYLSRINARDPNGTKVRFSKEEYEALMNIERMHPSRLEKYVKSLMGQTVTVPDPDSQGGWKMYTLFEEAECFQDSSGQWWIDLSCTNKAKKLFFNLDGIGYIRYQLKNVLPLTSKYSIQLYLYLLDNRYRSSWSISLEELRENVLHCVTDFYKDFKRFNTDVLKKALKEVNDKTDLTFSYTTERTGRRVSHIRFNLVRDEVHLPHEVIETKLIGPGSSEEYLDEVPKYSNECLEFLADACENEFSDEEMQVIFNILTRLKLPDNPNGIEFSRYNFLAEKYAVLNMQASKRKITSRFGYLKKILEASE